MARELTIPTPTNVVVYEVLAVHPVHLEGVGVHGGLPVRRECPGDVLDRISADHPETVGSRELNRVPLNSESSQPSMVST